MIKTIKTAKQNNFDIDTEDAEIVDWFARPNETMTDIILHQINTDRLYDPVLSEHNNLTILDIGANVGLFSLYAHDCADRIIALEPTPNTFGILQKLTKDVGHINPLAVAVSDADGEIDFYINDNPTINSIVNESGTKVTVQARTLETVLKEQGLDWVDFVKCDIEGSEIRAITPATLEPVKDKIGSWFIEVHQTNTAESAWPGNLEQNRQNLMSILKDAGYSVEPIIHDQIFAWKE